MFTADLSFRSSDASAEVSRLGVPVAWVPSKLCWGSQLQGCWGFFFSPAAGFFPPQLQGFATIVSSIVSLRLFTLSLLAIAVKGGHSRTAHWVCKVDLWNPH